MPVTALTVLHRFLKRAEPPLESGRVVSTLPSGAASLTPQPALPARSVRTETPKSIKSLRRCTVAAGTASRCLAWGGERAMVVEQGDTWTRVPGTDAEVRLLANRPVALRYRRRCVSNKCYVGTHSTDRTEEMERT